MSRRAQRPSSKAQRRQRHKELRRAKVQAEIRAYRARRRRRLGIWLGLLVALIGGTFVWVAVAQRSNKKPTSASGACSTKKPERSDVPAFNEPPPMSIDTSKTYTAAMQTSCGTVTLTLADDTSPQTVNSFVFLARQKFFDGLTFHRVTDFAVQGGAPNANGTGSVGYKVAEPPAPDFKYSKGIVAMAKGDNDPAGTSGSQFFIIPNDKAAHLNGTPESPAQYAVLGTVTKGFDALDKLAAVETYTPQGSFEKSTPRKPIYIVRVTITER
jgi:cyclophilin family peptidyl-prolyl cis-trans isomerase